MTVFEDDLRPYWNEPEAREAALKLIADAQVAIAAMKAAGENTEAVLDTLAGTVAHLIATDLDEAGDLQIVGKFAWALTGKIRDARKSLPNLRAQMAATSRRQQ